MKLFIDLETLVCSDTSRIEYITEHMKAPGNYKFEAAIEKWMNENRQKTIDNTVFDGSSGSICTIGFTIDDNEIKSLQRTGGVSEKDIIQEFFDSIQYYAKEDNMPASSLNIKWVAHNAAFDLPFLFKRCVILGINTYGIKIPHNDRHNSKHLFCTMTEWMGFGVKAGGSLDNICNSLGLEGKKGFDGSMVGEAFSNGEFDKIANYCADDVSLLRKIYKKMTFYTNENNN